MLSRIFREIGPKINASVQNKFCSSNVIFSKSVVANMEKLKFNIFNVNIYFVKIHCYTQCDVKLNLETPFQL